MENCQVIGVLRGDYILVRLDLLVIAIQLIRGVQPPIGVAPEPMVVVQLHFTEPQATRAKVEQGEVDVPEPKQWVPASTA